MGKPNVQKWKTYEKVTKQLLNDVRRHLGIGRIEGKQKLKGNISRTEWEVDCVVYNQKGGSLLVECKDRSTAKIPQDSLAGLAYKIKDTGAEGGIIVTPIGLQKGAQLISGAEKITEVILNPNENDEGYIARIANQLFLKAVENIGIKIDEFAKVEIQNKQA